jgi:FkbM family methyltransferase
MLAKLQRNLTLNPELQSRTQTRQILFTAERDERLPAQIYASWPLVTGEVIHPKLRGRLVDTSGARVDTLDDFAEQEGIRRLDLIKLDVDGQEYQVLNGGVRTLARFRPTLLMEMSPYVHDEQEHGFSDFVDLLREREYSLQEASSGKPLPLEAGALQVLIPDGAGLNVIARPAKISTQ